MKHFTLSLRRKKKTHAAGQKHTRSPSPRYTAVISCYHHTLHWNIAVDAIVHTHSLVPVCSTHRNTHSDMTVYALCHTCMGTHAQSDCIRKHPSYTQAVVVRGEVLLLFPLSLSLSPPLRLYWPLCSSRLHKAEPSGTTDKSWVISQAVYRWRGKNIKTIWYSYAQHLTHKQCLWAWRRHADIAEPMESRCETQG